MASGTHNKSAQSMPDNENSNDEQQLFRDAMQGVTPLKADNRNRRRPKKKPVHIRHAGFTGDPPERFSVNPVQGDCPTVLDFARSGVQPNTLKKLRQGKLTIESELDLHGMSVEQARTTLLVFLEECRQFEYRCVCIVHGKGYSSPDNRPVIKPLLNRWLRDAAEVLAFHSALPKHGGSGSLYVLLRRQRE
jgi:DNA-nicking Smr family endonuclease